MITLYFDRPQGGWRDLEQWVKIGARNGPGGRSHTPTQAHETYRRLIFDMDPGQARAARHEVFDRLEREGMTVAAGHFPAPSFGKLGRASLAGAVGEIPHPQPLSR